MTPRELLEMFVRVAAVAGDVAEHSAGPVGGELGRSLARAAHDLKRGAELGAIAARAAERYTLEREHAAAKLRDLATEMENPPALRAFVGGKEIPIDVHNLPGDWRPRPRGER